VIFGHSAQALFPLGVEFRLSLATPQAEIITGRLTLAQASGFEASYDLTLPSPITPAEGETPPAHDVTGGGVDTTEITKLIVFDSILASPMPFEPINYRWEIDTGGLNPRTSIMSDQVLFQPRQTEWQVLDQAPLSFTWYNPNLGVAVLRQELMPIYDLMAQHTRLAPTFRFALFEADFEFCQSVTDPEDDTTRLVIPGSTDIACQEEDYQAALARAGYDLLWTEQNDFDLRLNGLLERLFTGFYEEYWGEQGQAIPTWYERGLAQFYRRGNGLQALAFAQDAAALGQLLTLNDLSRPPSPEQTVLWQAQSYLFLLYLADEFGAQTPFQVAQAIPQAESFEAAFEEVIGQPLAGQYRAFLTWVDSPPAEVAALWNPYLPATPTVTPTATATLIPPTDTPTATATITLTPTSTSLIGRIPTQVPTLTPSPTLAVTASNTPLPPGSQLPTFTPVPSASAASDSETSRNLPCGTAAILPPGVGMVWWSRRRGIDRYRSR
jgi:hypothetical protein